MNDLAISIIIALIAIIVIISMLFYKELSNKKKELMEQESNHNRLTLKYRITFSEQNEVIDNYKKTEELKNNDIKSWKESSELKQLMLDTVHIKLDTLILILNILKSNWNKHLIIKEDGENITFPSLRLSIHPITEEYQINTYQGSRDLQGKTDFYFGFVDLPIYNLSELINTIQATYNPVDSKEFQTIINSLKKENEL